MRTLYEGSLSVADADYIDPDTEAEIENLDKRVTKQPIVGFTLDYPFEKPYEGKIVTDAGATLRQIIDAIRGAYRTMYRGTTVEDIPNLENKRVTGEYGQALHVIEDLVIESIEIDEKTGQLEIFIGS